MYCVAYKQQMFISHSFGGWKSDVKITAWLGWVLIISSKGGERAKNSRFSS
jgi:hypothetical protein